MGFSNYNVNDPGSGYGQSNTNPPNTNVNSLGSPKSAVALNNSPSTSSVTDNNPNGNSNTSGTQDALAKFYASMTGPLDMNDPQTQSILQGASSSAGAAANAQGIGGPMSVNASQQAYTNAAATMQMQRAGLGLQSLGQLSNTQLGTGTLNLETAGQNYEENFNNTYAPWEIAAGVIGGAGGLASGLGKLSKLAS